MIERLWTSTGCANWSCTCCGLPCSLFQHVSGEPSSRCCLPYSATPLFSTLDTRTTDTKGSSEAAFFDKADVEDIRSTRQSAAAGMPANPYLTPTPCPVLSTAALLASE